MADHGSQVGTVPFQPHIIDTPCQTYYKIIGDLSSPSPRLVIVHGGPGAGHEYLLPYGQLWEQFGIPVVFYDQVGCASSTHLPQTTGNESFWTENLFVAELENLLEALHLQDGPGYHLLGHSFGSRVVAALAATQPQGMRRLILASGLASSETWVEGMRLVRDQLPDDARLAIVEGEKTGNVDTQAFKAGMDVFFRRFFCRAEPFPPKELLPAFKNLAGSKYLSDTIKGPFPLECSGSFRNWTIVPRLPHISAPTLVFDGEHDTSHPVTLIPYFELIPRVRWITFPGAGHMLHLEGPETRKKLFEVVGGFLTQGE